MADTPIVRPSALDGWRREAMRVVLAASTAAGTAYASVRSALADHDARIEFLESQQQKTVPRQEIEAHWESISRQLDRIEQDIRDLRYAQRAELQTR